MPADSLLTDRPVFRFHPGTQPLLLSMPHAGTYVPPAIVARLNSAAQQVPDTDWHLATLYGFARHLGASILLATHSRYVVDLNRPPDGASLYPGQSATGLCPVDSFDGAALYVDSPTEPDAAETSHRLAAVWQPYHRQLAEELRRIKDRHGVAVLWDAHSIRSVLPRFFAGTLPDFNLGTAQGASCDPVLAQTVFDLACREPGYSAVLNGRFTGGYITRCYGCPEQNVHAIQMEMTQSSYMQESLPFDYLPERAARVQPLLRRMLTAALQFAQARQQARQ